MKYIIAMIKPQSLEKVKEALYHAEIHLMTVSEVIGHGRQKGVTTVYRGNKETGDMLRKLKLEIAINEEFYEPCIEAIIAGAKTEKDGDVGDGKIFVLDLHETIRIRTGERGQKAIG
jgi:nitrogen regulatory protein P-II 1